MRTYQVLAVLVALFATAAPEVAAQAEDEAAIRHAIQEGFATWNNHDAKAHMAVYVDDYQNWTGTRIGRAAWEEYRSEYWARQKDSQVKLLEEIGIIFVTPDVAIFKARAETTGLVDEDGNPMPPSKWLGGWVLVKEDNKWLVSAIFSRALEE